MLTRSGGSVKCWLGVWEVLSVGWECGSVKCWLGVKEECKVLFGKT